MHILFIYLSSLGTTMNGKNDSYSKFTENQKAREQNSYDVIKTNKSTDLSSKTHNCEEIFVFNGLASVNLGFDIAFQHILKNDQKISNQTMKKNQQNDFAHCLNFYKKNLSKIQRFRLLFLRYFPLSNDFAIILSNYSFFLYGRHLYLKNSQGLKENTTNLQSCSTTKYVSTDPVDYSAAIADIESQLSLIEKFLNSKDFEIKESLHFLHLSLPNTEFFMNELNSFKEAFQTHFQSKEFDDFLKKKKEFYIGLAQNRIKHTISEPIYDIYFYKNRYHYLFYLLKSHQEKYTNFMSSYKKLFFIPTICTNKIGEYNFFLTYYSTLLKKFDDDIKNLSTYVTSNSNKADQASLNSDMANLFKLLEKELCSLYETNSHLQFLEVEIKKMIDIAKIFLPHILKFQEDKILDLSEYIKRLQTLFEVRSSYNTH